MSSFKVIAMFALIACAVSETPRRQQHFRTFSRQEEAANGASDQPAGDGYNYNPPAGERLRLPSKLTQFSRQEESSNGGYSYPKPTDSYGPPGDENTEEPSTEYGAPEATTEDPDDESVTDSSDDIPSGNQEVETLRSLQATQLRRKNAKLTRNQKFVKKGAQLKQKAAQLEPVYYVQYPSADLVQPQYVYLFK